MTIKVLTGENNMKKSKCLLVSAIFGTLYLVYLVYYFMSNISSSGDSYEALGAGIATAIVLPHMLTLALAVIFNWVGWAKNLRWAALTGGILYSVSAVLMLIYLLFEIVQIVLSFVGFAKLKAIRQSNEAAKTVQETTEVVQEAAE